MLNGIVMNEENTAENPPVRLNKYLSEAGFCSRREADRMKVAPGQTVAVRGVQVVMASRPVLIAYNKPAGVECTADHSNPDNIVDRIGYPLRIYPVGRLDKESTGLILLTNMGDLMNSILKTQGAHEKEYQIRTDGPLTDDFLDKMRAGVDISGNDGRRILNKDEIRREEGREYRYITLPCKVTRTGPDSFNMVIVQGLNRQIRRMCLALGRKVTGLRRVRIMNITLGDLPEGNWREIEGAELEELMGMLDKED